MQLSAEEKRRIKSIDMIDYFSVMDRDNIEFHLYKNKDRYVIHSNLPTLSIFNDHAFDFEGYNAKDKSDDIKTTETGKKYNKRWFDVIGTIEEVYGITFDGACEKLIQYLEIIEKGADTVEVEGYEDIESLLKEIDEKYPYYELDTEEEDLKNDELAEKVECGLWDKEIDKIIIEDVDEVFFDDLDLEEAEPSIYGNMDIEDLINVIEVK